MDAYIGEIRMFAGNFAPQGWAFCNGELLSIAQNTALFSLLGTTYGGDGRSSFALPNLQSRMPVGAQNGGSTLGLTPVGLGEMAGHQSTSLSIANLPAHSASVSVNVGIPAVTSSSNVTASPSSVSALGPVAAGGRPGTLYSTDSPDVSLKPFIAEGSTTPVGSNAPIDTRNPYLGVNFIICLTGEYPPRS